MKNNKVKISEEEHYMSRAMFIHSQYDDCCGVLDYMGEFLSDMGDDIYELVFKCKKCGHEITLI